MTTHSDDAKRLAGDIACSIVYPRFADMIVTAQRYCGWDGCELRDEQVEQITRAMVEALDGTLDAITGCIDARNAFGLLEGIGESDA